MKLKALLKKVIKKLKLYAVLLKYLILPIKNDENSTVAFVFNVSEWKRPYVESFLSEFDIKFIPNIKSIGLLPMILKGISNKVFIIWGFKNDEEICEYAKNNDIPVYRLEDGFVRSVGLGSMHTPPYSLCLDRSGMYFDSSKPSDLEKLLNSYDFQGDSLLLSRAKSCISDLQQLGISKYNHVDKKDITDIYGPKITKRILVIGQVEDDASILKGSAKQWSNNDLVRLARKENPDADIIYKPHPDVLTGRRKMQSNPADVKDISKVIEVPLSLSDSFKTIDHVYTITSLSGFEAIIRDIPVTTVGAPFYSGWGLTDDRQIVDRRKRKLTKEELFAGAYILYPRYMDPLNKKPIVLEDVIKKISQDIL